MSLELVLEDVTAALFTITVRLVAAKNLPNRLANPFFAVYLAPDPLKRQQMKSRAFSKTRNPEVNETFKLFWSACSVVGCV